MNKSEQLQFIREVVAAACEPRGLALVDARFCNEGGLALKIIVERPGSAPEDGSGVSLADCQEVSREVSLELDEREGIVPKSAYRLEVGSPGLERPLFGLSDYERFVGKEVRLQATRPVEGCRRFTGTLQGIEGEDVLLAQEGPDNSAVRIPHSDIAKANLVYRF